jgi:hypothetical protein
MFSDPYRKAYGQMAFASGDDAYVEAPARRDALAVLLDAVQRCWEQDMHTEEVRDALDFLGSRVGGTWMTDRLWKALHHPDVGSRRRVALAELRVITRNVQIYEANSRRSDF